MATDARTLDLLGGTSNNVAITPRTPTPRPTSPDGLVYLDTGEYTPLYHQLKAQSQGVIGYQNVQDPRFTPNRTEIEQGKYKWDEKRQEWFIPGNGQGPDTYIDTSAATKRASENANNPIFSVSELQGQGGSAKAINGLRGAATGALAGSALGPAGVAGGAALGAIASMGAGGRQLQLSAGDPNQNPAGARIGTAAEAAQGNANFAATGNSTPAGGWNASNLAPTTYRPLQAPMATYTPGSGTNGNSALSADAQRIVQQANQMAQAGNQRAQTYFDQAATAGQRAAPQMAMPSSANQQAVYDRAMGFQAQSGADAIRAERADVSGAGRLESMQMDMQGINNLESFQPVNSQQGVNALYAYRPDYAAEALPGLENFRARETAQGVTNLETFNPAATQEGYRALDQYSPVESRAASDELNKIMFNPGENAIPAAQRLAEFRADRSGIDRLNAYADEAQGPSAAQAMLRAQSDADKRTALAIAKGGRGGPAAQAQAMRQAISEGAAIAGETRGQGAALAAQEHDAYKARQLQAIAQSGQLLSNAEAQRLSALQASGSILSAVDAQKLAATQAFAQLRSTMDSQSLQALEASGALRANYDQQRLSATQTAGQMRVAQDQMSLAGKQTAGQMRSQMDQQMLGATSNAAALQGQMDSQILGARSNAAQLRLGADQVRSQNLQSAGQIRLAGSEINQRGAIAASQADLQAQALNLQSLSLAGNISTEMRNQDINVLRSNLDAQLQTLGLNDNQVRFFNQLGNDREVASNNLQMSGEALGLTAQQVAQAQNALNLQWEQFGLQQLTSQQQLQYQYDALNQQGSQFNQNAAYNNAQLAQQQQQINYNQSRQTRNDIFTGLGSAFTAISSLFPTSQGSASSVVAPVAGLSTAGYQGQSQIPMNMNGQYTGPTSPVLTQPRA